ncbi:MAG: hypothetical protein M0Z52_11320 [Actinomycetota bacterium]|nr:hypothetical protein [Actinomycetota bacterium]MDA8175151.1 hypothetical protein [Nitrospiraceae bacterium]
MLSGVFGLVWLRSSIRSVEYDIGNLEVQLKTVASQRKALSARQASLFSVQDIGGPAFEKLGLVYPDRRNVFFVTRDKGDIPYEASYREK